MTQALTLVNETPREATELRFTQTQLDLLKTTIAKGTTDEQFALFCEVAQRTGLNPFAKQIYAVMRNTKDGDKWVPTMTIQTGVDGYRLIAQRTGEYAGQQGPFWCGDDGEWRDVWLSPKAPAAAKVGVLRHGFLEPVWGVATAASYMQTTRDGKPSGLWGTMPDVMIAKCAEVLALRKAFPQELSGMYADVEMDQADSEPMRTVQQPRRRSERKAESPPTVDAATGELVDADPLWTSQELTDALKAAAMTVKDLSPVLGSEATRENYHELIDTWFFDNPGKRIADLIAAAVAHHTSPPAEPQPALLGAE